MIFEDSNASNIMYFSGDTVGFYGSISKSLIDDKSIGFQLSGSRWMPMDYIEDPNGYVFPLMVGKSTTTTTTTTTTIDYY